MRLPQVNRRSFIKTLSAAAVAAPFAGSVSASEKGWDSTCDLVVIGAGGAGLSAAVAYAEARKGKVVVLEKAPTPFMNSTSYSAGAFNAAGTKAQKEKGLSDNGNQSFADELVKAGKGINDEKVTAVYARNSGKALDWFYDKGMKFNPIANSVFSSNRQHLPVDGSGVQYIKILLQEAKKLNIEVICGAKALALETVGKGEQVDGVLYELKGKKYKIQAKQGVIIASGGFAANPQLVAQNIPAFQGAMTCSSPNSQGEGLLMAEKIGAASTHLPYAAIYSCGVLVDPKANRGLIFRAHLLNYNGSILVNEHSKRFMADDASPTDISLEMARNGFKKAIYIATLPQLKKFIETINPQVTGWSKEKFLKELDEQKVFCKHAPNAKELAEKIGVPPAALEETINHYNQLVEKGNDSDFHRKFLKDKLTGELYAFVCSPVVMSTLGGLKVNDKLQVLDVYGKPIKKLYAAGEVVGGFQGGSYVGGSGVGSAMSLGRAAGESAAGKAI